MGRIFNPNTVINVFGPKVKLRCFVPATTKRLIMPDNKRGSGHHSLRGL